METRSGGFLIKALVVPAPGRWRTTGRRIVEFFFLANFIIGFSSIVEALSIAVLWPISSIIIEFKKFF